MTKRQTTSAKKKLELKANNMTTDFQNRNVPCLFIYQSNIGVMAHGSPSMVAKFKTQYKNDDDHDWDRAITEDQEHLNHSDDVESENLENEKGICPPPLLPADLHLMRFNELFPYVQKIPKNHWRLGGTKTKVSPGEPEFQADFWPEEDWK